MIVPILASFAIPLVAAIAATSAGLPVLIHLLSRQRFQVIQWAAMRFLVSAQKRHRRRVDRWILLALRVLGIVLLLAGLCAATPWAEQVWQYLRPGALVSTSNAPRTHHVLVIDASLSMNAVSDAGSRFQKAVIQLEQFVRTANPGDGFTLIALNASTQIVIPGPASDPEKVVLELLNIKPTHGTCDYASALPQIADVLARSPRNYPRRQVTIFTDLQRSAWNPILAQEATPAPEVWQRITSRADVGVVDLAATDRDNLSVTDLTLSDSLALVDTPTALLATIQNFGQSDKTTVRVDLRIARPTASGEMSLIPVDSKIINRIEHGKQASVAFSLDGANRFRDAGSHLIQVKIAESDDLPADDQRTLAVDVREALPCLLVNGKPATDFVERATGYLQTALDPAKLKGVANPAKPRTVSLAEFSDASLSDLAEVDCVFLCDVANITAAQVSRLEALLKRGGGVVIGLGPNVAENLDRYNELLFNDGNGILPGKLLGVKKASGPNDPGFVFHAEEKAYTVEPLMAFRNDNARAGLTSVPFQQYVLLDAPTDGRARRILSFVPAKTVALKPGDIAEKPAPAIVEMPRHRGRVLVYTSTFNRDWTFWPVLQSYLPMMHELLKYAATNPDRHTLRVAEALEEYYPATTVGVMARILDPEGGTTEVPIVVGDEAGVVRLSETNLSGLYRVLVPGQKSHLFAVNAPESTPGGGSESDLVRVDPQRIRNISPMIQLANDTESLRFQGEDSTFSILTPRAWGPTLARWLLSFALVVLLMESWYAYHAGPARTAALSLGGLGEVQPQRSVWRFFWAALSLLPLLAAAILLFTVAHAVWTGPLLGYLPDSWRAALEVALGVPGAGPGEGSRWRLESFPVYLKSTLHDRWLLVAVVLLAAVIVASLYVRESRVSGRLRRVAVPALLRLAAIVLIGFVLLPQLRIAFDRESWPDVAVLLDTSASMATVDQLRDPAVREKARELMVGSDLPEVDRLRLAKLLLTRKDNDWLNRLLTQRQVKVHLYSIAEQARLIAELDEASDIKPAAEAVLATQPDGNASQIGDAVEAVLKAFRGGSLSAMIVFTDGMVTNGDPLSKAARKAARSNVPLYFVGLGDSYDPPDLVLSDLKADDVVIKGDQLLLEARLTAKGLNPPSAVPVILSERQGDRLIERSRQTVTIDPSGKPVPIRLTHTPLEVGEKTFVIEVPAQPGEAETLNNRLERVVLVTESKRLKVLFVEGQPRYEYRFVKALLERETEEMRGNRAVELDVLLLDASVGHWQSDKSAERLRGATPTKSQLFEYDVVIFGDVLPTQIPKSNQFFLDLVEYVKVKGGGLLVIAGEHATPHKLFDTPMNELVPVLPSEAGSRTGGPASTSVENPILDSYLPRVSPLGRTHPLFRFVSDENENAKIWESVKPFYWFSTGWRKKATAEVLATHPIKPAESGDSNGNHPLVLQHFVGAGRVIFFGFDETWRWRWRSGEERFNHFWTQAVRAASRSRVTRIELKTDKQTAYRRNEPIRVTVRYPDDAPVPPPELAVKVHVIRKPIRLPNRTELVGESEILNVSLAKVEGTRATYETLLTRTPEGEYTFLLNDDSLAKNRPRTEARVLPPPGERDRLDMNRAELIRAAAESRGKFYTLADVETLLDDLPEPERVPLNQPCPPLGIWNHAGLFALIVMLLGCEWWVRRRERLV